MMHRRTFLSALAASLMPIPTYPKVRNGPQDWPLWEHARPKLVSPAGRVIDTSDVRSITTSEGQSYALFMALVDNDHELFRTLLHWTARNLAGGDLSARLPAWLWGQRPDGSWGVLDENPASDSDLWIAYCLLEAGRLWKLHEYTSLGTRMLQIIARTEVRDIPGLGYQMLPAPKGFVHDNLWRLNPSYLPPQVLARVASAQPDSIWPQVYRNSVKLLLDSSPLGLAPDWINWNGLFFDTSKEAHHFGSYDAIRVYLWVGMVADDAPDAKTLKVHFRAIEKLVLPTGQLPERIDITAATGSGHAPAGFTAAIQPLFSGLPPASRLEQFIQTQDTSQLGYYNQMLVLFSQGWMQDRYRFNTQGQLLPRWNLGPK